MSTVEAVIVAHNAGQLLMMSVQSLLGTLAECDIVVVDNASVDGSVERMAATHTQVRVLHACNDGFAAGNNKGIAETSSDWVLLLNPDAELLPGALSTMLAYGIEHADVGVVGPEVLDPDGRRQSDSRGAYPSLHATVALKITRMWARLQGRRRPAPPRLQLPTSVDWLTGACMLVRRDAIEQVGLMDEGFFLYYEDVDWCHRMHDAGWDVVVVSDALVIHHLGQADASPGLVTEEYRKSRYRYYSKYGHRTMAAASRLGARPRSNAGS